MSGIALHSGKFAVYCRSEVDNWEYLADSITIVFVDPPSAMPKHIQSKFPIVLLVAIAAICVAQKPARVAFRLDDVQDSWLHDAQVAIMDTFQKAGVPLTVGIIGGLFGRHESL